MTQTQWYVMKNYYRDDGEWMTDTWPFVFYSEQEALTEQRALEAGKDRSWYAPGADDPEIGDAVLFVDQQY